MSLRDYIRNDIFADLLKERGCLVVYDPQRCYKEIAESLSSDRCRVILAGESLITSREEANASLGDLALGKIQELVIWVPFPCLWKMSGKRIRSQSLPL